MTARRRFKGGKLGLPSANSTWLASLPGMELGRVCGPMRFKKSLRAAAWRKMSKREMRRGEERISTVCQMLGRALFEEVCLVDVLAIARQRFKGNA